MLRYWIGPFKLMLCIALFIILIYAIGISVLAHAFFYDISNGSLIYKSHHLIGSRLLGQAFTQEKYFWPRPSATNYQNDILDPELIEKFKKQTKRFLSASSVDPHITVDDAMSQVARIAKARSMQPSQVMTCLKQYYHSRFLGIFGQASINVLELNLALDNPKAKCHA